MSVEAMKAVWDYGEGSVGQRLVLLALANRADEHGVCWPSVEELMRKACMSRRGVQTALRALKDRGHLVTLEDGDGGRGRAPLRWINLPGLDGSTEQASSRRVKGAKRATKGADDNTKGRTPQHLKGADDDTPYIEEPSVEPSRKQQAALSVFDHWREVFSKNGNTRMDSARRSKISARLKSFSVDDLKRAIDGASADEWITGRHPDSPGYGLVTILRDDDQVDRFMALAERNKPAPRRVRA